MSKDQFKPITSVYEGFVITRTCVGRYGTTYQYSCGQIKAPRKKDVKKEIDDLLLRFRMVNYELEKLDKVPNHIIK